MNPCIHKISKLQQLLHSKFDLSSLLFERSNSWKEALSQQYRWNFCWQDWHLIVTPRTLLPQWPQNFPPPDFLQLTEICPNFCFFSGWSFDWISSSIELRGFSEVLKSEENFLLLIDLSTFNRTLVDRLIEIYHNYILSYLDFSAAGSGLSISWLIVSLGCGSSPVEAWVCSFRRDFSLSRSSGEIVLSSINFSLREWNWAYWNGYRLTYSKLPSNL